MWPSGYNTWLPSVSLHVRVSAGFPLAGWPGRYINVRHCEGLFMVLLQLIESLELFVKRREVQFSIPRDMT